MKMNRKLCGTETGKFEKKWKITGYEKDLPSFQSVISSP